jgi:hypothetical protein
MDQIDATITYGAVLAHILSSFPAFFSSLLLVHNRYPRTSYALYTGSSALSYLHRRCIKLKQQQWDHPPNSYDDGVYVQTKNCK